MPDDARSTTEYLANGQITTDPNGKTVTTRVTGLTQEVERLWNGAPSITTTTFDAFGRRLGLEDAKGHTWTYQYDSLDRLWHEYDPDAGHWEYDYDDAGRPRTQTDAKGQVTTMTYDAVGRIATKVSPVGTVTYTYSEDRGSSYFNKGRLTTITSPVDTLRLDYDELGRAKRQQRVINGTTYEVTKSWDAGGYLVGTTYPDGYQVGNTTTPLGYDQAGRLKSIPNFVSNITYDAAGRPTQKTNASPNGAITTWTYTPQRGFLERIRTTSPAGTLQDLTYGYDAAGLVQNLTQQIAGATSTTTQSWTYEYDDFYHLKRANDATTPANTQTWEYDEIGRIMSNSRVGAYDYPLPGQPRPHAPRTVNGGPTRTYDANGNLLTASGQTLTWDGENRHYQAVVGGTTTKFA